MPEYGRDLSRLIESLIWPKTVIGSKQDAVYHLCSPSTVSDKGKEQAKAF